MFKSKTKKMSKMITKPENLIKSQKITLKKKSEKKAILLVFQYKEDAIRQELSSPARFRNTKISKNPFFLSENFENILFSGKKCYSLSFTN